MCTIQMPCKAHSANSGSMLGTLCSTAGSKPRLSGVENMAGYREPIKGSKVPHPVCLIISLAIAANVATPLGTLTAYKSGKSQASVWLQVQAALLQIMASTKSPCWLLLQLLQDCRDPANMCVQVQALSAIRNMVK